MKSKEYANRFLNAEIKVGENGELGKIMYDFLAEVKTLKEMRRVSTDQGMIPILREQNQKFRSFARLANEKVEEEFMIKPQGFMIALKNEMPDIYAVYQQYEPTDSQI